MPVPNTVLHTFVVLAYKDSPYLEECLASLRQQTVQSKIIISTSTPSAFLEKIAGKYYAPLLVNEKSKGIASDWSFAYSQGKTRYVTLAHQDDLYLPRYTERCVSAAEKRQNNLITFTNYCERFDGGLCTYKVLLLIKRMMLFPYYVFKQSLSSPFLKKLMLSPGNPVCCPSIMYNTENIGYFEFDPSFSMNLDWEASLRLAEIRGDFIYIKKKLLVRRIHNESETTYTLRNNTRQTEDKILLDRLWPKFIAKILAKAYSIAYKSNNINV